MKGQIEVKSGIVVKIFLKAIFILQVLEDIKLDCKGIIDILNSDWSVKVEFLR